MPSLSQSRAPTRAPILQMEDRAPSRSVPNSDRVERAGLTEGPSAAPATPDVDGSALLGPSAEPRPADQGTTERGTAEPPAQEASQAGLSGPTARLQAGDLLGAGNELRQIASEQRRLLSGGGDRALLQSALAALAVVESLVTAQQAKDAGNLLLASRHAQTAGGTLRRAPTLDGPIREVLEGVVASFGARTAAPGSDVEPQRTKRDAPEGYDPALGQALARASAAISGGNPRAGGRCYARVADAVDAVIGRFLSGGHAYMAAAQLAARKSLFTEIPAADLSSLPAGAIVVWGKGSSRSGHISVALGDGRESSDFVGTQMTRHYGGAAARVFLPRARMPR